MQWMLSASLILKAQDKFRNSNCSMHWPTRSACRLIPMKSTSSSSTLTRTKRVLWNTQNSAMLSYLSRNITCKSSSRESLRTWRTWKHMNRCSQNKHVTYIEYSGSKSSAPRCWSNKKDNFCSRIHTLTFSRPLTILKDKTLKVRATASSRGTICPEHSCFPTLTRTFYSINSTRDSPESSTTQR